MDEIDNNLQTPELGCEDILMSLKTRTPIGHDTIVRSQICLRVDILGAKWSSDALDEQSGFQTHLGLKLVRFCIIFNG